MENGEAKRVLSEKGRSLQERVYQDEENVLRADHNLNFYGIRFLNLHYKMNKKTLANKVYIQ